MTILPLTIRLPISQPIVREPVKAKKAAIVCPILFIFLPLAILLISLAGCMPLGIPEHFSPASTPLQTAERLLIVSNLRPLEETALRSAFSQASIGRQYVCGFVPLTRLFLAHGQESLILESLLSAASGAELVVTSPENASDTIAALRPDYIIQAEGIDLDITAYDALFLRTVSLSGEIRLRFLDSSLRTLTEERVSLSSTRYRRYAYATELGYYLEKEIQKALTAAFAKRPGRLRWSGRTSAQLKSLAILPPVIPDTVADTLGADLAQSYGYASFPPLERPQVARIVQRGLAFSDSGLPTAAFVSSSLTARDPAAWELETTLHKIERNSGKLTLSLSFRLSEGGHLMYAKRCSTTLIEQVAADASLIVTVERGAAQLAEAFFNRGGDNALCTKER